MAKSANIMRLIKRLLSSQATSGMRVRSSWLLDQGKNQVRLFFGTYSSPLASQHRFFLYVTGYPVALTAGMRFVCSFAILLGTDRWLRPKIGKITSTDVVLENFSYADPRHGYSAKAKQHTKRSLDAAAQKIARRILAEWNY